MSETKSKTKEKDGIEINGLKIIKGVLYKIENKLDKSAPDGFQKEGTTKLIRPDSGNIIRCDYDDNAKMYDTGFYVNSACYTGMDSKTRKDYVDYLTREIVTPYENFKGEEGILHQTNFEFWDNTSIELYEGRVFNPSIIKDYFELYIAMRCNALTPENLQGDPRFNNSDYIIKNSEQSISIKKQRVQTKSYATSHLIFLIETKEENAIYLLKSLDIISLNLKPSKADMLTAFDIWLDKDVQNADIFEALYEKSKKDEGLEEIILKVKVKDYITKGRIKKEGSEYLYKDIPLGIDIKSIVYNLQTKEELAETRDQIRLNK